MAEDERDVEAAQKLAFVARDWDDGLAMLALWLVSLALALLTGVVLLVAFLVLGRSAWAVVAGTIVGVLGGAVLGPILWFVAESALSRLVRHGARRRRVREAGVTALWWITYVLIVLPSAIVFATSLLLS